MRKGKGMRTKKEKNKDKWPQLALLKILWDTWQRWEKKKATSAEQLLQACVSERKALIGVNLLFQF